MIEITHEEFEKDYDNYLIKIDNGEQFLIRLPSGRAVAAVPQSDVGSSEYVHPWYNYADGPVEKLQEDFEGDIS